MRLARSRIHSILKRATISAIALLLVAFTFSLPAADLVHRDLERSFTGTVRPFLENYCFACHGKEKQKGQIDLSSYSTLDAVVSEFRRWETVLEKLKTEEMPPEEAKQHPSLELRRKVIDWIQALRKHEAQRNAGDPGPVLARRLNNAEYDYTIRDLTGVDIRPTREFPVDPANEAGFDNSGESLTMSPALLCKYLEAARRVAEHIVLKPQGFVFAPHPVVTDTDRDKYCVKRVIDFYERQNTNYADYFLAAWRFKNRDSLGKPKLPLADFAADGRISWKYLATLWSILEEPLEQFGPLARLQTMWRELPQSKGSDLNGVRIGCERMRDFIVGLRSKLKPEFKNLSIPGIAPGSQPFVLWKDHQYAVSRMSWNRSALRIKGDPDRQQDVASAPPIDPDLLAPSDETARLSYDKAFERFCRIFPDSFYLSERGLIFLKEDTESRGRLLSAGFHLMVGYFRDDVPLYELILDEKGQHELDALWQEFHFITQDPMRQFKDFIFFERAEPPRFMQGAEFDFARSEDKDVTSETKIQQLADAYLAKARRNEGEGRAIGAIEDYFRTTSAEIRSVEESRLRAEPSHIDAVKKFAARAYRRPLSRVEADELTSFHRSLREKDGLSHEDAIRDTVVSVLMSPHFCYRLDLVEAAGRTPPSARVRARGPGKVADRSESAGSSDSKVVRWKAQPLTDYALASRLSYFLWSSMPDEELLACAAKGSLHRPDVFLGQARRMSRDGRIRGLAVEFGGNWLDFRRFEEHNSVDRERFKSFNNELRQAMFEEPIHFFVDLIHEDRSLLDLLYADYTFVNPILAEHYGMTGLGLRDGWIRVDDARRYNRGGLLPMSVFLTKNAPGLRTSPVKRGYWVVRRLLGEYIPPPPPKVPELPADEGKLGELTLRETLARHRQDKSCSGCHEHFDGIGLVFEGYGPIGETRVNDLAGRPVDTHAKFPGGAEGAGLDGLRHYLHNHRQDEFLDNLCRKLLSYALGRTLLISDDVTIANMRAKLETNGNRFGSLIETIVTSPQFLNKRSQLNLTSK
ncbi:MAG: DUF1592 domain-containing protein [Pedosphaera sp.]|nr:DUF1592 domain-containing protein [Pedosphaera sp.]